MAETPNNGAEQQAGDTSGRLSRAQALFHRALGRAVSNNAAEFGDSEVGRLLCATRMRLGKDLQAIAKVLHIRYNYLVAIEDGRYEDLPGQAYAIGFVRAYADHLDLDGDEIVRRYKEDSTGLKRKAALDFVVPTADSGVPSGIAILAAMGLGIAVYGVWYGLSGLGHQTPPVVQEVPARLLPASEQPGATAEATPQIPESDQADATGDGQRGEVGPEPAAPLEAAAPTVPPPASVTAPADTAKTAPVVADGAPVAGTSVLPPMPPVPPDDIQIRAKSDSWIQIRDGETVILTRFLHKGDAYKVPNKSGLTLMTANAGGIEILVNGEETDPLGDVGAVASGIILDADHLKGAD
jgi:cytoskeleton protein RodZ